MRKLQPSVCKESPWSVNVSLTQAALLTYDTLLTLPSEITYIWHRRVRLGTVLYLLARYPMLLTFILLAYINAANIPLEVRGFIRETRLLTRISSMTFVFFYTSSNDNTVCAIHWVVSLVV
jgi:Family of unknown function (DUF6533)